MEPAPVPAWYICVHVSTRTAECRLGAARGAVPMGKGRLDRASPHARRHYRWDVEGYLRRKRALIPIPQNRGPRGHLMLGMR